MTQAVLRLTATQAEFLEAQQRGRDPEVFAAEILRVRLNPAQRRWFRLVKPHENGWEWRLKAVLHVAANQIGKTLGLGILIIWANWYKIGIDTDDSAAWLRAPYLWMHLAPTQQQAYLTLKDIVLLLDGTHIAQKGESLLPKGLVQQVKIEQYYDGLSFWNGSIVQFRTTEDKAKALQGRRASGISYDEAAFEDHLKSVINETLLMRLISTGGPLWLVSTPNGINDWFEVVTAVQEAAYPRIIPEESDLYGGSAAVGEPLPMWETEDGWALVWSTVADNVGYGIPEDRAEWMEQNIDAATKEQQLRGAFLEPQDAFFVPSDIIDKAFREKLPLEELPQYGHKYVIAWDVSEKVDPTVAIVIDITKKPWRGVYFRYYERPLGETKLLTEIYKLHAFYNGGSLARTRYQPRPVAITTFDATSMGGSMLAAALASLTPKRPLNLAGPNTKRVALVNLRAALSKGDLILPKWPRVRREVLTYKLPDDKIRQDCVMTLLENVDVAGRGWSGESNRKFAPHGRVGAVRTR